MMTSPSQSLLLVGMGWDGKPRGMDRYIQDYAQQLCQHQHPVTFCGVGVSPALSIPDAMQLINLASPDKPVFERLRMIRQEFLKRPLMPIDAINLHFSLYSFPLMSVLPKDVPITFTFHGPYHLESQLEGNMAWKTQVQYWIERYVYDRCDHFIVLSKAFGQLLHQLYRVPEAKIHVIPGGVNLDWFHPAPNVADLRTHMNWPQDRFIVFTARRFSQRMGIQPLIAAMDRVRKYHPEVLLAIAGNGDLAESLTQQVKDLKLDDYVKFLGYLPEPALRQCYQAADLTAVPSQDLEGFGLVVIESLACGTPVLCTPVGGMQEIMTPFAPDLITPSCGSKGMADHLCAILRGELRLPSSSQCRTYVEQQFNWSSIIRQIELVLLQ